jgi:MtfA peptidase
LEFSNSIHSSISQETIQQELEQAYPFYKNLNRGLKKRFLERTFTFIQEKKFVGRQDLKITNTIRVIIAACAVQVTFGLDSFALDKFEYIVVYPAAYESPITKKMHKGETNLSGFMCFSWKDVLIGIENPNDNYNLGLHEWTHALRFNGINFDATDYFFDNYINKWVAHAMYEFNILKSGKHSIFRRYGAANIHEFLSVCTEHFFESPDEFKNYSPTFFDQMCILFNQIPSKTASSTINVRARLLFESEINPDVETPLLILEASLFRTITNFGVGLLYFLLPLFFLVTLQNATATIIALLMTLGVIVRLNNMYVSIQFFEKGIFFQKGFFSFFARKNTVNYHALMKVEIYEGNLDSYNMSTVFNLNYYEGNLFLKKTAYCSAMNISQKEIKTLLQQKKVAILWSR